MNNDRVKVLVNIYLDKYDEMKESGHLFDRWIAVSTVQKNWDLQAEDFGEMFRAAMADAGSILDSETAKPLEGIQYLCDNGHAEDVRKAFSDLLDGDGGDISQRQQDVLTFVQTINDMLYKEVPLEWNLRQKIRSGIRYLGIIAPGDNYIFKASFAAAFAGYCEVDEEIGYDKTLKLANYYEMMNDVTAYIGTREDLLAKVNEGLAQEGAQIGDSDLDSVDARHHILAYDLVSKAYRYDFYSEKSANRKSKISTVAQRRIERFRNRAELLDEREKTVDQYDKISAMEAAAKIPDANGREVVHRAYGKGKITEQDGKYLTVEFESGAKKKFALPGAIVKGYLDLGSNDLLDACNAMEEVIETRKKVEDELTSIDVKLSMLE